MNAPRFTRLGLGVAGLAVAATLAFAGNAQADQPKGTAENSSLVAGGSTPVQQVSCERAKKLNCNRPGRRSTRR